MWVLTQFLFRLAFGLSIGMAVTSPRQVTSGYFRNHLYVILGLNTLATLVALAVPEFALWPPLCGALVSYVGSVLWLYEKPRAGRAALVLTGVLAIAGAWQAMPPHPALSTFGRVLFWLDPLLGGTVLGVTMAAMLLGHWYLNTPTMQLAPLRRLLVFMAIAILVRTTFAGIGLGLNVSTASFTTQYALFVLLRWLAGLLGALGLTWMTWKTLDIPNTQSATGILYVAVIATFLGELVSQLLSAESTFPL